MLHSWCREAHEQQAQERNADQEAGSSGRPAAGDGNSSTLDWQQYPEAAAAVVIFHELIMKIKRILLTYT